MRFCPFCSAENADELAVCQACGRRLPPLPPRRTRNAPPTGVQLPMRSGKTNPPPLPAQAVAALSPPLPAPVTDPLLLAITPGPAAQRRDPPLARETTSLEELSRRRTDFTTAPVAPEPSPLAPEPSPLPPPPAPAPAPPVVEIAATRPRDTASLTPPPTRVHRPEGLADRPFSPPQLTAVPEIPEPGLINAARYTLRFARAWYQRRGAIKQLGADIKGETEALDQVLGELGRVARNAKVEGRVFSAENGAITAAEDRGVQLVKERAELDGRKADENSRFVDIERERNTKLADAERLVEDAQRELTALEAQRRGLRDKRKEVERRQKAYLKGAEDNDRQAGAAQMGDSRQELRRAAEGNRKEAAALEPERQDAERQLAAIERPITELSAKLDAAKAELYAAKRSLADAREGHTHRLAELDAEQLRKAREIAQAEGEIARRLVTLGTLVNLNRVDDARFAELYERIDRLRTAITARTTEIEKLSGEREAFQRGTLVRGVTAMGIGVVLFIALIVILRIVL